MTCTECGAGFRRLELELSTQSGTKGEIAVPPVASFWRSSTVTRLSPTALRSSHPSKAFEIKATSVGGLFHFKCHLLALLRRPIPEVAPFDGRFGRQVDVLSCFDARADVSQFAVVPANRSSIKALQRTRPFDDVDRDRATGRASRRHYPPCGGDRRSPGSLRSHAGRRANISGKTVPRSREHPCPVRQFLAVHGPE